MTVDNPIEELRKLPRKAKVLFQHVDYGDFYDPGDVYLVTENGDAVPKGTVVVDMDMILEETDDDE